MNAKVKPGDILRDETQSCVASYWSGYVYLGVQNRDKLLDICKLASTGSCVASLLVKKSIASSFQSEILTA